MAVVKTYSEDFLEITTLSFGFEVRDFLNLFSLIL